MSFSWPSSWTHSASASWAGMWSWRWRQSTVLRLWRCPSGLSPKALPTLSSTAKIVVCSMPVRHSSRCSTPTVSSTAWPRTVNQSDGDSTRANLNQSQIRWNDNKKQSIIINPSTWFSRRTPKWQPKSANHICYLAHEHMFFGGGNICYLAHEHMFLFGCIIDKKFSGWKKRIKSSQSNRWNPATTSFNISKDVQRYELFP